MGRSVNKVTLIGTLGRDPEVRVMPNGNAVANINIATDESYNDKQTGQKVEQTEWHRLVIYGKLAEICQQYLKKGSRAYFEGRLRTREWEKDGIKRYTTEINCFDMMMLDSRSNDGMASGMNNGYQAPQQAAPQAAMAPQAQPYQQPTPAAAPAGYQAPQQQGGYQQPAPNQAPQQNHQQAQPMQQPTQPQPSNSFDDFDDDIPF